MSKNYHDPLETIRQIVATCAGVTKDVPPNMVVGGMPAQPIRNRRTQARAGEQLQHIWLHEGAFPNE